MPGSVAEAVTWNARLSTPGSPVCAPDWLALREGADALARSSELVQLLRACLATRDGDPAGGPTVIRDLGCGTGSMARWLAGRLLGPQHWILHDRDRALLTRAVAGMPVLSADGDPVTAEQQAGDLATLRAADIAGTDLVTASALLDLLTLDEVDALADAVVEIGCPALLTLSVAGRAELAPTDPLDHEFETAFNAHQRRHVDGRRLLGPDAPAATFDAFAKRDAYVQTVPSPWRLGAHDAELLEEWLRAWLSAACEQRPDLAARASAYLRRRLDALAAGRLQAVVWHVDVLVLPGGLVQT